MPSLKIVGAVPTAATSLATRKKTDDVITGFVGAAAMQAKVDAAVATLTTQNYVDGQDGQLTTKTYVDQQDALYIPNTWKASANGIAENVSGAIPAARFPLVPTFPMIVSKTWRDTDFAANATAGTGEVTILNSTVPMSTNSSVLRFMVFGNFEAWAVSAAAPADNLSGKPVFKVYINNLLVGLAHGRNGAGSASSTQCTVMPVGDDLAHTPGTGWADSSLPIKVTLNTAFANTTVGYARSPQTLLSVLLVAA